MLKKNDSQPLFQKRAGQTIALLLFCSLLLISKGSCFAAAKENLLDNNDVHGVYGLVVHQARSRLGNDFFQYFSSYWQPLPGTDGYNIFISDKVHPRFGTWVFIAVNDVIIHRARLETRLWEIEQAARKSIDFVTRYIIAEYGNKKNKVLEDDLVGDGL